MHPTLTPEPTRARGLLAALLFVAFSLFAQVTAGADQAPTAPASVPGLVAWYRADSLRGSLQDGDAVIGWQDESGNGHDLKADKPTLAATFGANQVNGLPALRVRKGGTYSVATPFALTNHTIFLVYQPGGPDRALFRSGADEFRGMILRAKGVSDHFRNAPYNNHSMPPERWVVTVLARNGDVLTSFIDGVEKSAGGKLGDPLQVGLFFDVAMTRYVRASAEGLRIAEMLFYDRHLDGPERDELTRYLSDKYGLQAATGALPAVSETPAIASVAQLSTNSKININEGAVAIPWDLQDSMDEPFRHDLKQAATRLSCAWDSVRVRLYVSLPLTSAVPGAGIRVLFRVNGSTYLRGEGRSGTFGNADKPQKISVQAEVIATLNAKDYVEVLAISDGVTGTVTIDPGSAVFIAEMR